MGAAARKVIPGMLRIVLMWTDIATMISPASAAAASGGGDDELAPSFKHFHRQTSAKPPDHRAPCPIQVTDCRSGLQLRAPPSRSAGGLSGQPCSSQSMQRFGY